MGKCNAPLKSPSLHMSDENRGEAIAIKVPSKGGEEEESKEPQPPPGVNPEAGGKKVVVGDEMVSDSFRVIRPDSSIVGAPCI